jgi:predicted 3-demethylubiquinone-9 3-methyltransferase (glyoxalase superfamily)
MGLERPEGSMIPFDELTQEQVVGWVKDKFGPDKVTEIEEALAARIVDQQFPTVEAGVPWQ